MVKDVSNDFFQCMTVLSPEKTGMDRVGKKLTVTSNAAFPR
ncbi:hypothetical protein ACJU26_05025 [Acidithiobacillus sp. M4-SHS-6]